MGPLLGMSSATALGLALFAASPACAQAIDAAEAAELRAQIAALKAQVEALEARIGTGVPAAKAPPAVVATAAPDKDTVIGWKGSPILTKGSASFKVKGRIQYDAGLVMPPDAITDRAKGYSNELRRLRLGAEGQLGAGFGYKLETELSDNSVDLVDTFITWERGKWLVTLGNHNAFQSLDELISDTGGSVMERAAFTDAFGFERRLGLSVQYRGGVLLAQAGAFSDSADSLTNDNEGDQNNSYGFDGRIVLAPKWGSTQFHFGLSGHWRDMQRLSNEPQRYRQRPYLHSVNTRYLETPQFAVTGEQHYGLELAGEHGPLWWAGEAHWLKARRPMTDDPTFFGGYGEVGYVFTGESRGYKNGIFGVVKPDRPVGGGGLGALQGTIRYDYLDLNDGRIIGGKQNGWIAALVWTPIENLRFNMNYAYLALKDAALPGDNRPDYSVNVVSWRAELDF